MVFRLKNASFAVETKHDEKTKDEEMDNGNSAITNRYRLGG